MTSGVFYFYTYCCKHIAYNVTKMEHVLRFLKDLDQMYSARFVGHLFLASENKEIQSKQNSFILPEGIFENC